MKKLFFSLMAAATALTANAQIEAGDYFIQNVETGHFLNGANDWGTKASITKHGQKMTIAVSGDGYSIDSHISNGGNSHFVNQGTNLYTDGAAVAHTFEAQGDGTYAIKDPNGKYLLPNDGTKVNFAGDAVTAAAKWKLISMDDVATLMATATIESPVDATYYFGDANFSRNNQYKSLWTVSSDCTNKNLAGGNNDNMCAESYHSKFTISQQATVPNGVYAVTAQGFYRQDGSDNDNLPVFFANEETTPVPLKTGSENSMGNASSSFSAGQYTIEPIYVEVTDGTLNIGIKNPENASLWVIWDNFEITYYGDCTIEEAKNAAIVLEWRDYVPTVDAKTVALDADGQAKYAELKANIANPTSAEALAEAKAALDAASIAAVKAQTTMGAEFTGAIVNPNFDGNIKGWTDSFTGSLNHGYQNNNTYGTINQFMECWAGQWSGATAPFLLPDGKLSQVITNLPAGTYTLTADAIATQQQAGQEGYIANLAEATGIYLFAGDTRSVALNVTGDASSHAVSMYFTIAETQDVEIGLVIENTNCNWAVLDNVKLFKGARVDMAVNADAKWSTFCAPFEVAVPAEAKAYTVDGVENDILTLTEVSTIAANTPVVLNAETGVPATTSWGDIQNGSTTCGLLTGVYETTAITSGYVLQNQAENGIGFYMVDGVQNVPANKAYLTAPAGSNVKAFFFDGVATGIQALESLTAGKAQIYDLNGRQLQKLQKGINIVNGVKVLVK